MTSGALTFMILAAALVTASFLMSPVIEDVFGEFQDCMFNSKYFIIQMEYKLRKMNFGSKLLVSK